MHRKEILMKKLNINNRRYLGSKYKLLDFIDETIKNNCGEYNSIFDVFGGTGVVSNYFYEKGKKIYINDMLKSNYCVYRAFLGNEKFSETKIEKTIREYNNIENIEDNYFSKTYKNTYFSENDCKKIGYIREDIENKYSDNKINEREKYILITSLLYSMDRIANTVGHYDAYRKKQNLQDKFEMFNLDINRNKDVKNEIYNMDSNELVKKVKADIAYIDPPYNSNYAIQTVKMLIEKDLLKEESIIIIETDNEERILNDLENINVKLTDKRKYGRAHILFLAKI